MVKIDSPAFLGFTPATKQFLPFAYSWHFSVWNWPVLPVMPWVMTLVSLLMRMDMSCLLMSRPEGGIAPPGGSERSERGGRHNFSLLDGSDDFGRGLGHGVG